MRPLALSAATGLLLVLACSSDAPTAQAPTAPMASVSADACPTVDGLRDQITALFPAGLYQREATSALVAMRNFVKAGDFASAQAVMFKLVNYTLTGYYGHQLVGDQSASTQQAVVTLINGLYCYVGLAAPNIPLGALGDDGVVAVIDPTMGQTTVVTPSAQAGVDIPAAATPTTTVLAVYRLPDTPHPLNTALDQYPAFYEFQVSPVVTFNQNVLVGACQLGSFAPADYGRLKIGHNLGGTGFELLPKQSPAFLDCTGLASINADPSINSTCCLGGTTKSFSPFGAVDTSTTMDAASLRRITGAANSPVPSNLLPAVQILTPQGHPVPGITVTFSVPQGSEGSITGATQVTDQNGIARVGSWTLGSGQLSDKVIATGVPFPGSGLERNGLDFTATVQ